ncbi:MAG TPA: DUF305 domain-containing protein [Euzebyales bacterium]|nr:DUF305 domain-containing protein [Euzebyales bacterium]
MGYGVRGVAVVSCMIVLAACSSEPAEETAEETADGAPVVQLGAPGEDNRKLSAAEASELQVPAVNAADVEFVRMMIPHHEQALEMTALVPSRTERDDLPLLAERIEVSQTDEIEQMQRWLDDQRHDHASAGDGQDPHAGHDGHLMPGMATPEEMSRLSAVEDEAFDELFLQLMIRHHEGAVTMVEELLASGEGGQNPEVFQLAQHIEADQRVEIARMKQLLADLASEPARR